MTTRIQILGTGCAKCRMLTEHAENAARKLGIDYELENVTEIERILDFGVVATPALVVDGEILVAGRVPSTPRLVELLTAHGAAPG